MVATIKHKNRIANPIFTNYRQFILYADPFWGFAHFIAGKESVVYIAPFIMHKSIVAGILSGCFFWCFHHS